MGRWTRVTKPTLILILILILSPNPTVSVISTLSLFFTDHDLTNAHCPWGNRGGAELLVADNSGQFVAGIGCDQGDRAERQKAPGRIGVRPVVDPQIT